MNEERAEVEVKQRKREKILVTKAAVQATVLHLAQGQDQGQGQGGSLNPEAIGGPVLEGEEEMNEDRNIKNTTRKSLATMTLAKKTGKDIYTWMKMAIIMMKKETVIITKKKTKMAGTNLMTATTANKKDISLTTARTGPFLRNQSTAIYVVKKPGYASVELVEFATTKNIGGRNVHIALRDFIRCPKKNTTIFSMKLSRLNC